MTYKPAHESAGQPNGGQFAQRTALEPGIVLVGANGDREAQLEHRPRPGRADRPRKSRRDSRPAAGVRWGLMPSWAKDVKNGSRLINARRETILEKPSFRSAAVRRRSLVPAGQKTDEGKIPSAIAGHPRLRLSNRRGPAAADQVTFTGDGVVGVVAVAARRRVARPDQATSALTSTTRGSNRVSRMGSHDS